MKHGSTSSAVHARAYTRRVAVPGERHPSSKRPTDFCNLAGEHGGRAEGLLVEARVRELFHVVYVLRARHGEGGLQREQHPGEVVAASSPASSSTPLPSLEVLSLEPSEADGEGASSEGEPGPDGVYASSSSSSSSSSKMTGMWTGASGASMATVVA